MAKTTKKKVSGGGKLTRTQTVTIRLDPQLRYLAELAARTQRRTVSSFIEWAIEESLKQIIFEDGEFENTTTLADEAFQLWDVDEPDRFVKLAFEHPHLLTHEEQVLWKLIKENGLVWKGKYKSNSQDSFKEWKWYTDMNALIIERLREHWQTFRSVANGEKGREELPTWEKTKIEKFEDDIPF